MDDYATMYPIRLRVAILRPRQRHGTGPGGDSGNAKRKLFRSIQRNPPTNGPTVHLQHEPARGHADHHRSCQQAIGKGSAGRHIPEHPLHFLFRTKRGHGENETKG